MSDAIDLNIDSYNVEELLDLFHIREPYTPLSIKNVIQKTIDEYIVDKNADTNKEYIDFFNQVEEKLIRYFSDDVDDIDQTERGEDTILLPPMTTSNVYSDSSHYVIEHPNLAVNPTYNQEYVSGVLNPVKRRIIKKSLLIDTRFRSEYENTQSTDFTIQLPTVIKNVISMKLSAFEFPSTFYVFSEQLQTNIMTIVYNGVDTLITIKPGNYTSEELRDYMNNEIFANPPFSGNVECLLDTKYGKFTFFLTPAGIGAGDTIDLDFRIPTNKGRNIMLNMGWILGFREALYVNQNTYEPEGIFDATGFPYIYLIVDDFKHNVENNFVGAFENSIQKSNILARIPQPAPLFQQVFDDSSDLILKKRTYFGPVTIEKMRLQILDQYQRVIDINNMDWSMSLEFECIYNL
jgi:hypothetical protein